MKSKHTPEPWNADVILIEDENGNEVACITGRDTSSRTDAANAARIVSCVNALRGVPSPVEAVERAVERLERIVAKCQQYENAPRLEAAEQHAVNEWIERQARAALSLLRPGEEDGRDG